jgi:hypothetical protein
MPCSHSAMSGGLIGSRRTNGEKAERADSCSLSRSGAGVSCLFSVQVLQYLLKGGMDGQEA